LTRPYSISTETGEKSITSSLNLIELELLQWDDWKENANRAQTWFEGAVRENRSTVEGKGNSQVQADNSQISKWWDGTAATREEYAENVAKNAERFGNQVKKWWGEIAASTESAIANVDIGDKATTIEKNFQSWWNVANKAERQWWNATVHQIQIDEKTNGKWLKEESGVIAERTDEFINITNSKLSQEKEGMLKVGGVWLNVSKNELGKDAQSIQTLGKDSMDSTKDAFKDLAHAAEKWLKSSEETLKSDENKILTRGQELLNSTEEKVKFEEMMAMEEGADLWNSTSNAMKGDEAAASDRFENVIDSGRSALKGELEVVGDEGKMLLNETETMLLQGRDAADQKFATWWATTMSAAHNKYTDMTIAEKSWWNATELWLRWHIDSASIGANAVKKNKEKALLYLNNSYAYSLLMNGYHWYDYSNDFFLLQGGLDAQINQAYCAVASAAAVINSFRPFKSVPVERVYFPYHYATQENLFNECVQDTVIFRNETFDGLLTAPGGLSLEQLQKLMECFDFNVTALFVDPANVTMDDVRQQLEEALMNPSKRVIVNFDRRSLGQDGGGHFSPLGSYSKKEDSFLIMDVAKYKYPPVWVPTERLYISLATEDGCGDWRYPSGQQSKSHHLDHPISSREYEKVMRLLECRKMHRGFLIVQALIGS
jgi:hypothetical protein